MGSYYACNSNVFTQQQQNDCRIFIDLAQTEDWHFESVTKIWTLTLTPTRSAHTHTHTHAQSQTERVLISYGYEICMITCSMYAKITFHISSTQHKFGYLSEKWNKSLVWQSTPPLISHCCLVHRPFLCLSCCWHNIMETVFLSPESKTQMSRAMEAGGGCK